MLGCATSCAWASAASWITSWRRAAKTAAQALSMGALAPAQLPLGSSICSCCRLLGCRGYCSRELYCPAVSTPCRKTVLNACLQPPGSYKRASMLGKQEGMHALQHSCMIAARALLVTRKAGMS